MHILAYCWSTDNVHRPIRIHAMGKVDTLAIIEEHFSKNHSVQAISHGLSEFWKSAPQFVQ